MKVLSAILFFASILTLYGQEFAEIDVEMDSLKGTLSVPAKKTKTAILIIAGSGPTDRNGNSSLGLTNNSLKMMAEELTTKGYAVLRYDKRGIAGSQGAVKNPASIRFEDFVADAGNWLNFLSQKGYKNLIVLGHSQGSLVGMMAAQNNKNVKAFISLAGLAEDAGEAIVKQLGAQSEVLAAEAEEKLDSIRNGYTVKKYNIMLLSLFGPAIQPFLQSYIRYNPSEEIKKLNIPVLIINGTTDIQVGIDQAQALKNAYPKAELIIVEGMNHVLKNAPSDPMENIKTYSNPDLPLNEELVQHIDQFISKLKT